MEIRTIKIELIDELLGTNPSKSDIYDIFIGKNAPDEEARNEELEHLPKEAAPVKELVENGMTVFLRDDNGNPAIPCYHLYGQFKAACGYLRKVPGTESSKIKAYKKAIDGLIKVFPVGGNLRGRILTLHLPEGGEIGTCQRPLRAQTMQGERVALASSETVPEGTWFECDICCFDKTLWPAIEEWLDYGCFNGLGQWRSSGKGAFNWCYITPEK